MRCQKGAVIVKVEPVNLKNREAALVAPAYRRVARHLKIKQGQGQGLERHIIKTKDITRMITKAKAATRSIGQNSNSY